MTQSAAAKAAAAKNKAAAEDVDPDVEDTDAEVNAPDGDPSEGEVQDEIAARTADEEDDQADVFTKQFLVAVPYRDDMELSDQDHEDHAAVVASEAINNGLRVIGDIRFVSAEPSGQLGHAMKLDGTPAEYSTLLTYEADAVPAHLTGAGPTVETSDQLATNAEVVSPRDVLEGDDDNADDEVE